MRPSPGGAAQEEKSLVAKNTTSLCRDDKGLCWLAGAAVPRDHAGEELVADDQRVKRWDSAPRGQHSPANQRLQKQQRVQEHFRRVRGGSGDLR